MFFLFQNEEMQEGKKCKGRFIGPQRIILKRKINIMFSPLPLWKRMKNKTIILYFNACSICFYRVIPCVQRPFITQETFQKTARKSSETKGSQQGNFYWAHSLHLQATEAVNVLRTLQSCHYLQEFIPLALQTPEQATIKSMTPLR